MKIFLLNEWKKNVEYEMAQGFGEEMKLGNPRNPFEKFEQFNYDMNSDDYLCNGEDIGSDLDSLSDDDTYLNSLIEDEVPLK